MAEEEFSVPKEEFSEDAAMRDAPLSFDDLMMVELMFTIEEEFANCKIDFDRNKFCDCVTFGEVVRLTQIYLEGKENELEADYREHDESIEAYENDKELGTWFADDYSCKPRRARRMTGKKPDCARRERKTRKSATAKSPIRKLNKAKNTGKKRNDNNTNADSKANERHGRYRRRKETRLEWRGDGGVQSDGNG